jgi:hypothetical protein
MNQGVRSTLSPSVVFIFGLIVEFIKELGGVSVSILVHITYHRNPRHDARDSDSPFLKEIHYYVSNDTSHDSLFVQHAFMLHWEFLQM